MGPRKRPWGQHGILPREAQQPQLDKPGDVERTFERTEHFELRVCRLRLVGHIRASGREPQDIPMDAGSICSLSTDYVARRQTT